MINIDELCKFETLNEIIILRFPLISSLRGQTYRDKIIKNPE